jgi:hypothetical protein
LQLLLDLVTDMTGATVQACKQAVVSNWYIFDGIKEDECVCVLWG